MVNRQSRTGSIVYVMLVCLVAALGGLLFGYDTGVINGAIGPLKAHFSLDAKWTGWATGCALLGCAIGAAVAGALSDRFGRKKVLILSAVMFFISAVGTAIPRTITAFIIYRILGGIGVGAASISSPMYIAEISPARIRGRMVSVNQFAIVTGFLVVYFVNFFIGGYGVRVDRQAVEELVEQVDILDVQDAEALKDHLTTVLTSEMTNHFGIEKPQVAQALSRNVLVKTAWTWSFLVGPLQGHLELRRKFQPQIEEILLSKDSDPLVEWEQPAQLEERMMSAFRKSISADDPRVSEREFIRQLEEQVHRLVEHVGSNISSLANPVRDVVDRMARKRIESWSVVRGWRWMFGSEALPALLLLVFLFFVPESPRWLTKQNRSDEALAILTRVDGRTFADTELLEIKDALAHETGSLKQLLQPGMQIVLVIGIVLAVLQQVTGINVFLYFGTEIFKQMGSETNAALLQTVIVGAVNLSFTIVAIWTVDRLGRKPLMMIGSAGMGLSLLAMGLAAYFERTELGLLLFILGYIACFALSVGPVTWVILSEIFPTRIRGRAMAIATVCLWVANYVISQTFPMMDENAWLIDKFHHAFPFWLYGVFCVVLLVFVGRFVPETKGKTLEQIERHW
ncbi:MAG: sugar porter family MFS transporter, partial [Phycisphaerales bacterium]